MKITHKAELFKPLENFHSLSVKSDFTRNKQSLQCFINPSFIFCLTLFRMDIFGPAHGWGRGQEDCPFLKSVTHTLKWWNLARLYYLKKIQKIKESRYTHPEFSSHQHYFTGNFCYIKKYRYQLHFNMCFLIPLVFF